MGNFDYQFRTLWNFFVKFGHKEPSDISYDMPIFKKSKTARKWLILKSIDDL